MKKDFSLGEFSVLISDSLVALAKNTAMGGTENSATRILSSESMFRTKGCIDLGLGAPTQCQNGLTPMSLHFHLIIHDGHRTTHGGPHDGHRTAHGSQDLGVLKDNFTEMKELLDCT